MPSPLTRLQAPRSARTSSASQRLPSALAWTGRSGCQGLRMGDSRDDILRARRHAVLMGSRAPYGDTTPEWSTTVDVKRFRRVVSELPRLVGLGAGAGGLLFLHARSYA